jgi:hypothetical protein
MAVQPNARGVPPGGDRELERIVVRDEDGATSTWTFDVDEGCWLVVSCDADGIAVGQRQASVGGALIELEDGELRSTAVRIVDEARTEHLRRLTVALEIDEAAATGSPALAAKARDSAERALRLYGRLSTAIAARPSGEAVE